MTDKAIQQVCLNCAAPYPDRDLQELGIPDWPWWFCSPCRAEATGIVELAMPMAAVPATALLGGAIQKTLASWLAGLAVATAQVTVFLARLEGSAEEATAHAVMGTETLGDAHFSRHSGNVRTLVLGPLPPGTARRLAETTFAEGPQLSTERVRELAAAMETP